jgi:Cu2+-containing amine oxidase
MATVKYPTDPLTGAEITAVTNAIKADPFLGSLIFPPGDPKFPETALFLEVLLKEPKKEHVLAFEANPTLPLKRKARVHFYLNTTNTTYIVTLKMAEPPAVGVIDLKYKKLKKVTYPYNNYDNFPISDSFGGLQQFQAPDNNDPPYNYFTRLELTNLVLACQPLLDKLAKRNVTLAMLQPQNPGNETDTGAEIYPYAFYTFEALRNFIGCCGKICPDLVDLCAPNHRFMPAVFFNQTIVPGDICIETANWGIVEGIYIIIDLTAKKIYRIIDDGKLPESGKPPIPLPVPDPYPVIVHPDLQPLCHTMPQGVSFVVPDDDQHFVKWDNWEFHWSYQRSGISLYNIYYTETVDIGGVRTSEKRKIIYKNAASDTLVIYNVNEPIIARTYVSADSHNWPILPRTTSLVLGRDVPGYAKLFPVFVSNAKGSAWEIEGGVAIYEQDADLLWRVNQGVINVLQWPNLATPFLTGARKRQLVVRSIFSGFYYLFVYSYMFNQDGSMECYVDLMGQTTNQWVESSTDGEEVPNGQRVSKQLVALNHTHITTWRIDFDIDGVKNTVDEHNYKPDCSKKASPCGDAVISEHLTLKTEKEAKRNHCIATNRTWEVHNHHSLNRLGFPRGYEIYGLSPNGNSTSLARDDGAAHSHFPFVKHHLAVTKFNNREQFASGTFPVLANEQTGLPVYQDNNQNIEDTDIVVWYNGIFFHHPHTEDYAFINSHRIGVGLFPSNFFGYNPSNSLEQNITLQRDGEENIIGDCSFPQYFQYAWPNCP